MTPALQFLFFVETRGRREPHSVTISEPKQSGNEWGCEVEMTAFSKKRMIFGSTKEQALELAADFAKRAYSQLMAVDGTGSTFSWRT